LSTARLIAGAPGFGASVEANTRSLEPTVRSALARIELDEADATFVYRTDAVVAGARVRVIEIPPADNVVAEYPIGVVAASNNHALAEAFVAFVQSPDGQRHLASAGFDPPR
jgi:molybdate transport system substrate-binding protein